MNEKDKGVILGVMTTGIILLVLGVGFIAGGSYPRESKAVAPACECRAATRPTGSTGALKTTP
jgi:hypothetical protein